MERSSLRKGIGILGITGIIDYTLEFLKSVILAGFFGIAAQVDAYYSGKSFPEFFFSFTSGAAYGATLPNYPAHGTPEREKSRILISALVTIGGFGLIAFSAGALLSEMISRVFFAGLDGESLSIASKTMAILFISGFFRTIVGILRSYYDHVYQFLIPAALDLLLSLIPILFVLLLGDSLGVVSLPLGFLGASILIFFFLVIGVASRFEIEWNLSLDFRAIRNILTLIPPLGLGSLAYKLNVIIDRIFASGFVVGSISSLQYGYNPLNIIHALISLPVSSALFPVISQKIIKNDYEDLRLIIRKAIRIFMLVNFWGMWTLLFFRKEIISILYGRGAFDARAIELTSTALLFYSFGFSVLSLNGLFLRVMMSAQDKRGLYTVGLLSIVVNVIGDWILGHYFKIAGIAMTTSIVQITWSLAAFFFIRRRIGNFISRQEIALIINLAVISFVSVYSSYLGVSLLARSFLGEPSLLLNTLFILFVGIAISISIFILILYLIQLPELELLLEEGKKLRIQVIQKILPGRQSLP